MKSLFVSLVVLVGFALPAFGASSSSASFVSAYTLQENCFRGSSVPDVAALESMACLHYIAGVVDSIYLAASETNSPCLTPVTLEEMKEELATIYVETPDEELKNTSASSTVVRAFTTSLAGQMCYGGTSL